MHGETVKVTKPSLNTSYLIRVNVIPTQCTARHNK